MSMSVIRTTLAAVIKNTPVDEPAEGMDWLWVGCTPVGVAVLWASITSVGLGVGVLVAPGGGVGVFVGDGVLVGVLVGVVVGVKTTHLFASQVTLPLRHVVRTHFPLLQA